MCREIKEIEELFEMLENITMNNEYVNQIVTKTKNKAMTKLKEVHLPDVIGLLPKETKVRIINDPELIGVCNAGKEDRILCKIEFAGQEAYYLYKAIGIFLRSDLEVIDA